jgi:FlaA1/EpsC-like NDP-sugar epimerase
MHYLRKSILDAFLFSVSYFASFLVRFEMVIPSHYFEQMIITLPIVILLKIFIFFIIKVYHTDYNYFSVPNVFSIFKGLFLSSIIIALVFFNIPQYFHLSRSIIIIDLYFAFVLACGLRFFIATIRRGNYKTFKNGYRTLIIGAGEAGESMLREIRNYNHEYFPIGLIDDAKERKGKIIQGVKVLGTSKDIADIVKKKQVEAIIIAIPSADENQIEDILSYCNELNLKILKVPYLSELDEKTLLLNQLREVKPENVLFREQIEWDCENLVKEIKDKIIMVTGAGGSIGAELCRQIAKYQPQELILFERSEYHLFCINKEIANSFPHLVISPILADMTDCDLTLKIMKKYHPEIIFHAAAYKHVFLVERNPEIAIKNNVMGTMNIIKAAMQSNVKKLALISSDKAVYPTCIMGATKRICEEYIRSANGVNGNQFYGVRFGNVLGSSGSVLPIFKEQILRGGPVTVTDINAQRYFMTISEAVHLVLQTLSFAKGGEIYILDMGKPVRIYDLAKKLISISGLMPNRDIKIVFTGLKQGEKLTEELHEKDENLYQLR